MADELEKQEEKLADAFEDFANSEAGGYMENEALINALKVLRPKIFSVSYENVSLTAQRAEKKLCESVDGKWNNNEGICEGYK